MNSTVPPGLGLSASIPRHFVPGYCHLSLRDKSHSPIEGPHNCLRAHKVSTLETDHPERRALKGASDRTSSSSSSVGGSRRVCQDGREMNGESKRRKVRSSHPKNGRGRRTRTTRTWR